MANYKVTKETNADLKAFRVKLIELFILTLSAIFILYTFNTQQILLLPALILVLDILVILIALSRGANKDREQIEFDADGQTLKSKVEMIQISYEFTVWENIGLSMYAVSVVILFVSMTPWGSGLVN